MHARAELAGRELAALTDGRANRCVGFGFPCGGDLLARRDPKQARQRSPSHGFDTLHAYASVMHGIVLAAGAGTRMGGPKARLLIGGETLLSLHVRRLREAGCTEVVAVVAPNEASIVKDAIVAISTAPDPAGSLRAGLAKVPPGDLVITPVDVLPAKVETIAALVAALERGDAATPEHGHPVAIRRAALEGFTGTLRDVLSALGDRRIRVAIDDASLARDLDEPADVEALTGAPPTFLR